MIRRVVPLLAPLLFSACRPSLRDVVERHRKECEQKMAALQEVGLRVASLPKLAEDRVELAAPPPEFDSNALLLPAEDLPTLENAPRYPLRLEANIEWFWTALSLLRKSRESLDSDKSIEPSEAEKPLLRLKSLRYVLAIRGVEYVAAGVRDLGFVPGRYAAEAHLFEIDSRKHLGGFRIEAQSSERVTVAILGGNSAADLEADLAKNAREAIRASLEKFAPGSRLP